MKRTFDEMFHYSTAVRALGKSRGTSEKNKDKVAVRCRDVAVQTHSKYQAFALSEGKEIRDDAGSSTSAVMDDPAELKSLKRSSSYVFPSRIWTSSPGLCDDNVTRGKKRRAEEKDDVNTPVTKRRAKRGFDCYLYNEPYKPTELTDFDVPVSTTEQSSSAFLSNPCSLNLPGCSHSTTLSVADPPYPGSSHAIWQNPTRPTRELLRQQASALFSDHVESLPCGDGKLSGENKLPKTAKHFSPISVLTPYPHVQLPSKDSGLTRKMPYLLGSPNMPSFSKIPSTKNKYTQTDSLPDMLYKEFTPVITPDFDDETYRFQCSSLGLYLCSVTGLMFDMKGEGDVVYRIVPWNRRLLVQHHKKPAGPLFDIKCVQQCVRQLHLPHCEISSTGGGQFLSVAHVTDDGDVEFIRPQKITETHVVISVTGFSGYGNVKNEDSPPDPVRALVLLFYSPVITCNHRSVLNVLLVPRNVVIRDVQRTRRKLIGDERYIETSPHCKLKPDQVYTLSTSPQNDSIKVQPTEAEFDGESHSSYFTTFQVILKTVITDIELFLRDTSSPLPVWESEVCLLSVNERDSEQRALNLSLDERLFSVRSRFIDAISEPVLKSLLDKLLEKRVITDSERESVNAEQTRAEKARVVIDTVRKKGETAGSHMIQCFHEVDPFLCKHLGLR